MDDGNDQMALAIAIENWIQALGDCVLFAMNEGMDDGWADGFMGLGCTIAFLFPFFYAESIGFRDAVWICNWDMSPPLFLFTSAVKLLV